MDRVSSPSGVTVSYDIEVLPGHDHEGTTTASDMYAESVTKFLLG
jgi:hypothetical protein